MSVRYELRSRGVFDRETGTHILRGESGWADYEEWLRHGNVCDAQPPVVEVPIEERRREYAARVNGFRHEKLAAATVVIDGLAFDADPASCARLALAVATKPSQSVAWRTADNDMVELAPEALERLAAAATRAVGEIFAESFRIKDEVIATSSSPEAIDLEAEWDKGVPTP